MLGFIVDYRHVTKTVLQDDERRVAAVMLRKEEERKREVHKQVAFTFYTLLIYFMQNAFSV